MGSSHGGNIAMSFAQRYPAQVSELVLIGPEAEGFPYSEHFVMAQMAFQGAKDPTEVRAQNTYSIVPGNDAAREHLRRLLKASPQDHEHNDMPLPEKPTFPYAQDLRMPTLILVGSGDIADNQAVAGALVMAIPGATRVVISNTGHLLYLENMKFFFPGERISEITWLLMRDFDSDTVLVRKRSLLQRSSTCGKAPHFALHKGIAIGFLKTAGFGNKPKRTIVDVWCGDPYLALTYVAFPFLK